MSWKGFITASGFGPTGQPPLEIFRRAGCQRIIPQNFGPLTPSELPPLLSGVGRVPAGLDDYSARVLGSGEASSVKTVARWGVGFDAIALQAATKQGIVITYTPGLL